ncbi:transcriptional regulator [Spirochaetia bacterium]|nr:transcriptional regulator [Spirochaetia bacterium]
MKPIAEIKQLFDSHGRMLRTKDLYAENIFYKDIQKLATDGLIEKIRYGYYQWIDEDNLSEARLINQLFPDGVLNMDTALFYHGFSDRIPLAWHIAVSKDSGKSRFKIDNPFIHPYFVEPSLLEVGLSSMDIDGNQMRVYDKERTICDCLRYRNKMDREIFSKAIRGYVNDTAKNIPLLMKYADTLRVTETTKNLIGVWL